jgi:Flp pilus assembly protein TadD
MNEPNSISLKSVAAALLVAGTLAACTTTTAPQRATSQIEVLESVGFRITETAAVSDDIRADYARALALLQGEQRAEGVRMLEAITARAPDLSAPFIDLGIANHRNGDLEAAERNLLQALALNPDHPIAHNELGIVYRKTGRFSAARSSYEAALAIYPYYHYARRNLAILCDLYLADSRCALENYEAYMATVPEDDEASMWITDLRNRMGGTTQ